MSKYTTEVRYICETYAGLNESTDYLGVEQVIAKALPRVFDFSFPIFDESYRSVLETKILRHYYTREIGLETVGLWKLKLSTKLNEIMPYYNQLYKSEKLVFNPLHDVDLETSKNGNKEDAQQKTNSRNETASNNEKTNAKSDGSTNVSTSHSETNASKERFSDTPQGTLADIETNTYLTNATLSDETNSTSTNENSESKADVNTERESTLNTTADTSEHNSFTSTEEWVEKVTGKNSGSSYSKMLTEFRETFLNIDMSIINELETLFMQLW